MISEQDKKNYKAMTIGQLTGALMAKIYMGNLPAIEYLLSSSELEVHADVNFALADGFGYLCRNDRLQMIKYLVELKKGDIPEKIVAQGVLSSAAFGCEDVTLYLLNLGKLSYQFNYDNLLFKALEGKCNRVVDLLIWDYNIEYSPGIKDFFKFNNHLKNVESKFILRQSIKEEKAKLEEIISTPVGTSDSAPCQSQHESELLEREKCEINELSQRDKRWIKKHKL